MLRSETLTSARRILCLGAHSDDIEIGCGGTLLRLAQDNPDVSVYWVVFSATGPREAEAKNSAKRFLESVREKQVVTKTFRDGFFPWQGEQIKETFEAIKKEFSPDLIFTHWRDDAHQDHRELANLTWNTFRDHLVLEYEILKYDGDLGRPNVFVPLSDEIAKRKIDVLLECFPTQATKHWFTRDTFEGLIRVRGVECAAKYAEAFHCRKMVL